MALSQPKKPVGGAFGVFANEKRPEFLKACAGQQTTAVTKMACEEWKKLSEEEKEPFQKKYEAAKAQFNQDMAVFLENGGTKTKGVAAQRRERKKLLESKAAKKEQNADAPKRPVGGGYGRFLTEKRDEIKKSLPADHKMTDVGKKAGELWKEMPDAEKQKYEVMYKDAVSAYQKDLEAYKAKKEEEGKIENSETQPVAQTAKKIPRKQTAEKAPRKRQSDGVKSENPAKRERRTKCSATSGIELSDEILAKARTAGYEAQLKNLASRPDVVATGSPAEALLKALEASAGLVNPAKHALLGA